MKNRNHIVTMIALFMGLFAAVVARAEVIEIKSVEALEHHMFKAEYTLKDLVVFDADGVLTMPHDPTFQMPTFKKYRKDYQRFLQKIPYKRQDISLLYILTTSPQVPTHEKMVALVKDLQRDGVPTIVLTALLTGQFEQVTNAAEWRAFSLAAAGYDFATQPPEGEIYDKFPKHLGSYPKRAGNILMTNGEKGGVGKGAILVHYLSEKHLRPARLVFIDDRMKNIRNVESALAKHYPGIQVTSIHYTAASYMETPVVTRTQFKNALNDVRTLVRKNKDVK